MNGQCGVMFLLRCEAIHFDFLVTINTGQSRPGSAASIPAIPSSHETFDTKHSRDHGVRGLPEKQLESSKSRTQTKISLLSEAQEMHDAA